MNTFHQINLKDHCNTERHEQFIQVKILLSSLTSITVK